MKLASPIPISLSAALISLTAFSAFALSSISVSADAVVDTITVSVPESCTLSSASGSGETYNVSVSNGQYKNDIGKTRLSVFCNTQDSFAIYAVGYSNDAFGNTEMISSSASVPNIITGTATGGDTSNWAMKLEAVAGTGASGSYTPTIISPFNDFAAVPNTWAKVAEVASVTGLTNEAAVDASYAIYIAPRQLAASYQGKVRYTVVHPNNAPAPITLAIAYEKAGKQKVNGYYTMQDMSTAICDAATVLDEGSQMQAIDIRDNKTYWITKLRDGKCWMTQNLDHDISTTFVYTPDNTDIPANWTPDKSTYATGDATWDDSLATGAFIQQSYDPGNKIWDGTLDPSDSTYLDNMAQGTNLHYHLGNYYNFGAAVAMNDTSARMLHNEDINQSICPKGWTLPKSGNITTAGSFEYLVSQYGVYLGGRVTYYNMTNPYIWEPPIYFTLSGAGGEANASWVASLGYLWSSVVISDTGTHVLFAGTGGPVSPMEAGVPFNGHSVRCVNR